ncbi:MAG: M48 family metallopeptidase [Candidatus Andersenbacteria bacterium]|nr:M48 family metallopeptidase [Candidatus Andersenbacteria bacterium]MBI3251150.1 M48 family metallopeptidase [Candidatus Andersenbacteria bacterium]
MIKQGKYVLEVEGEHIPYLLRRSRRARNLLLHVELDGSVELVVPWHAPFREGLRFIQERGQWLLGQRRRQAVRQAQVKSIDLVSDTALSVFGEVVQLQVAVEPKRRKSYRKEHEGILQVTVGNAERIRPQVEKWYRIRALAFFKHEVTKLIVTSGYSPVRIRTNAATTQWGSCNKKTNTLTFNWRLALAPKEVALYVVAHEVAHLVHTNHSRKFWKLVASLQPDFEYHRQWLRRYGHTLSL